MGYTRATSQMSGDAEGDFTKGDTSGQHGQPLPESGLATRIIWEPLPMITNCLGKGTVFCLCSPSICRILKHL